MAGPLKDTSQTRQVRWEAISKSSPSEVEATRKVLQANKGKNFVQRILNASDWPSMQNPGGSSSTHRMANADNYAFPTLFYAKGTNALVAPENPMQEAKNRGEFIEFPSPEEAERFAKGGYKVGMDTGLMQQMLRPEIVSRMWR